MQPESPGSRRATETAPATPVAETTLPAAAATAKPLVRQPANGGTVSAGRGVLYIAAAKMYFMLAGAAIEFILPRLLGVFRYGAYRFVASSVSALNNVAVTGTIQAVSRYTTADPERADEVKAAGLRMHLFVGLPLGLAYAALAPLFAYLVHDSSKAGPLALSAAIFIGYSFYAVLVGSVNGSRAFHKQAGLDITFASVRAAGVLGASAAGLGVYGAIGGWIGAVAAILLVASAWVGLPRRGTPALNVKPMLRFFGAVAVYLIFMNLIMTVDQFLLKRLSAEWYHAHGILGAEAARLADGQVGYYGAVQNLARLPYQLILAVTFVIFPLVSRSTFAADDAQTRAYVRTTLRYSLVFVAALGVVLAANPGPMLDVPYKPDFAAVGGPALAMLALGNVAFAIFTIAGTILNGAGQTRAALVIAFVTLGLETAALWIAVPRFQPGGSMLLACATATSAAMLIGAVASLILLWLRFRAGLPTLTLVRVAVASGAALAVGRLIPATRPLPTLFEAAVCGLVFLGVLVVSGELRLADVLQARRSAKRGA